MTDVKRYPFARSFTALFFLYLYLPIGVDRYLGKPYQEPELLRHVYELLKLERDDD